MAAGRNLALFAVVLAARFAQGKAEVEAALEAIQKEFDQTVLESSPIYHCFQQDKFYYNADSLDEDAEVATLSLEDRCVDECPAGTVLARGQCVRAEAPGHQPVVLRKTWEVEVNCASTCASFDLVHLHLIRIKVAGYLDLTFQEVREVELAWRNANTLILMVKVETKRLSQESGGVALEFMLMSGATASKILNYSVIKASTGSNEDEGSDGQKLDDTNDPFLPAYKEAMPDEEDDPSDAEILGLPVWAFVSAVAGAVAFSAALGCSFQRHRCRHGRAQHELSPAPRDGSPARSSSKQALKDADGEIAAHGSSSQESVGAAV